jgi:predicted transcriptional regulator
VKQVELSYLLGVSKQAVNEWFKGKSHPRGELIVQIMEMIKRKPPVGDLRQAKAVVKKTKKPKSKKPTKKADVIQDIDASKVAQEMEF